MPVDPLGSPFVSTEYLDQLLTERDAATFLSYSQKALQKWRCLGEGPRYVKQGRTIRYRRRDLIAWTIAGLKNPPPLPGDLDGEGGDE